MSNKLSRILFAALLLACAALGRAQVSPFQGVGSAQFFDNNGAPLTAGVLYSYQAGTSTQQATYTDSTGLVLNPNPIPFGSGARVSIWLTTGLMYKFVLCLQNDGAFCAPADVLFSVDQVPGGASGGGGGTSPFTGTFISSSTNPATSGILRLASGDPVCFRNAAGTINLCLSKDSNDLLSWAGGALKFPEVIAPGCVALFDLLWADTAAHRWKMCNNAGTAAQVVASGVDVNTSDQVVQLHFGASAAPISSAAPVANQCLLWNGSVITTVACAEYIWSWGLINELPTVPCTETASVTLDGCLETFLTFGHTLIRMTYLLAQAGSGCSPNAVLGLRDISGGTNLFSMTANGSSPAFVDSGPLSIPMLGNRRFGLWVLTPAAGCGVNPIVSNLTAVYQ